MSRISDEAAASAISHQFFFLKLSGMTKDGYAEPGRGCLSNVQHLVIAMQVPACAAQADASVKKR